MKDYEPMMYSILKKYNLYNKRDDYIDLCYIGYAKALKNYDPSKSKFSTYSYQCMKNEVLYQMRKERALKRQRTEVSLDEEYDEIGHSLNDIIPSDVDMEQDLIEKETNKELREAISKLDTNEQIVIKNVYNIGGDSFNKMQIAKILKIDRKQVDVISKRALKKLKGLM